LASIAAMAVIRTERLVLRPAREEDLAPMHRILSDPLAMRYWSSLPHKNVEETRDWLAGMIEPPRDERDFIIELDGAVIGKVGCYELPEIGYILHPDHWGRGYAREAVAAAIHHIFARFDDPALIADIDPRNAASICLLEALGFEQTGSAKATWQVGEETCDSVYYALNRP
jgi:ribosomal-protein-alanine N-acetyltransferase